MNNPFKTQKELEVAVREYEGLRESGKFNMFALGFFWDKEELLYVMHLYKTGEAQKILKN